jgi:hypothetical protein
LTGPDVLLGSGPPADVVLHHGGEARAWALLFSTAEGWRVRDVGHPSGLRILTVAGETLTPTGSVPVGEGDVLLLGEHRVALVKPRGEAEPAPRNGPPPIPGMEDAALGALVPGPPAAGGVSVRPTQAFQPHLEVFEPGNTQARRIVLGTQPVLFGGDPGSHVRMTGFRMPDFVAAVETLGEKVTIRPVTVGVLGPKLVKDGTPLREEVRLQDGDRVFIGDVTVFFRLKRRR